MRKKMLSLLLVAVLTCSVCACGSKAQGQEENSNTKAEENSTTEVKLGDTVKTDIIEFSLTRVEFADKLKYATFSSLTKPDKEYLLPTELEQSNPVFVAKDGETFLSYSFSLKYLGKEELEVPTDMNIIANYNNGYKFETYSQAYMWSDYVQIQEMTKLKPLDPEGEGRGCMKVPFEVRDNEENSLSITVSIPNGDGTNSDYTYVIR